MSGPPSTATSHLLPSGTLPPERLCWEADAPSQPPRSFPQPPPLQRHHPLGHASGSSRTRRTCSAHVTVRVVSAPIRQGRIKVSARVTFGPVSRWRSPTASPQGLRRGPASTRSCHLRLRQDSGAEGLRALRRISAPLASFEELAARGVALPQRLHLSRASPSRLGETRGEGCAPAPPLRWYLVNHLSSRF